MRWGDGHQGHQGHQRHPHEQHHLGSQSMVFQGTQGKMTLAEEAREQAEATIQKFVSNFLQCSTHL